MRHHHVIPWSLPSIIEHSSEKSPSYCKNGYFFTHNRKAIKTHGETTTRLCKLWFELTAAIFPNFVVFVTLAMQ